MVLSEGKRNALFVNLIITCVALAILSTATNTILAPLMADFAVDAAAGQLVTSAYTLALAVVMPLTAYLVTRFPTKPLYLLAVGIYAVCSVGCAVAWSFEVLLACRIIQACANGLIANLTQVTILNIFAEEKRGSAMGWFGMTQGAAVVAGPMIGGLFADLWGWQSIFWTVAALCVASFVMALVTVHDVLETKNQPFDFPSFVLSVVAFGGVSFGLGNCISLGFASFLVWVSLGLGVIASLMFVKRQLIQKDPFLKVQLFGTRDFALSVILSMLMYLILMGSAAVLPLYVQLSLGQSALTAGLVVVPGAIAMALVGPVAGKFFDKYGMRLLAIMGGFGLFLSNVGMCFIDAMTPVWVAAALNVVRCVALGCIQMPLLTWGNNAVEKQDMPHASALLTSLRNIAGSVGIALFAGIMTLTTAENAMAGVVVAYAGMSVAALVFLVISVAAVRER